MTGPLRVAHATDIHWTDDVPLGRLWGKRILGTANQILRGRKHHFPEDVQQSLMEKVLDLKPDLFVITGDLTAQALPSEFEKAQRFLAPVLESVPTFIIPGNHDLYTRGARDSDRIGSYFGPQMGRVGAIQRTELDGLVVLGLDPNRPTFIHASGEIPDEQLSALADALESSDLDGKFVLLALHYPVLDRHGEVYDDAHHGLLNARALIDLLGAARTKPHLVIHGHEHHGFRAELTLGEHRLPCIDCGSSGYKHMPDKQRAAAFNLYEISGQRFEVERYLHDGARFVAEAPTAFASGR